MGGKGGSIVMLGSIASVTGGAGEYVFYAAAKGGIDSLTIGLAREVAKEGVRINTVRPGPTDTEIHEPGRLERITPLLPMGRPGEPDEIAESDPVPAVGRGLLRHRRAAQRFGRALVTAERMSCAPRLAAYDRRRNPTTRQSRSVQRE